MRLAQPRGIPLELHPPGDYVSDVIVQTGDFYEADILGELVARLGARPPGIVVDAGAMIGNHSVFLAAFSGQTEIRAFEPIAGNIGLLLRNLAPWPEAFVHPVALSDRERILPFVVDDANRGHHRVDPAGELQIPALPLDAFRLEGVSLLKIDVEGHEVEVLAGAAATVARSRPLILIEDWPGTIAAAIPAGYELVADWGTAHQTYLYAPG